MKIQLAYAMVAVLMPSVLTAAGASDATVPSEQRTACASPYRSVEIAGIASIPAYPESAREAGATGSVVVDVFVDRFGSVKGTRIAKSAGNIALDSAARIAAARTRYRPAIVKCVIVEAHYLFYADFTSQ